MVDRRTVLTGGAALVASAAVRPAAALAEEGASAPAPGPWRAFEIRVRIELPSAKGAVRVWVPVPADARSQTAVRGNATAAALTETPVALVAATWAPGATAPVLEVVSRVRTRARPQGIAGATATDGATAEAIRRRVLASGRRDGDRAALYVALARAADLPARAVCGIRISGSESLGRRAPALDTAHERRAEVWLDGSGWTPVDLRGATSPTPPGACKGCWIAYNDAHDLAVPGSNGPSIGFLLLPQAESVAGRLDCLDGDGFTYEITAREIVA